MQLFQRKYAYVLIVSLDTNTKLFFFTFFVNESICDKYPELHMVTLYWLDQNM